MGHPSGIADPILERLGGMVVDWSQCEAYVGEILARLLMADPGLMYVVTERVATSTQMEWIRTIVTLRMAEGDTRSNILSLLDDINAVRTDRNVYMHGLWNAGSQPGTAQVQTIKFERRELLKSELVTVAELDEFSAEVRHVLARLRLLVPALDDIKLVPGNANFEQ